MKWVHHLIVASLVVVCFKADLRGQETVSIKLPALAAKPDNALLVRLGLTTDQIEVLAGDREAIEADLSRLNSLIEYFNTRPPEEQTRNASAPIELLASTLEPYIKDYNRNVNRLAKGELMLKAPATLGFDSESKKRLEEAFKNRHSVDKVANAKTEADQEKARQERKLAWQNILARDNDTMLRHLAAKAPGHADSSGTQTVFSDCTIFALASATGKPYGWVAGLTAEMLKKAEWRTEAERQNPQIIMRNGLYGEEVMIMTEVLGQVQVIPESQYEETLKKGTPLMLAVYTNQGGHHQVVLSKTFSHQNQVWFEMMDSYKGDSKRLYLTVDELRAVQSESAIVYRSDDKRTPQLR